MMENKLEDLIQQINILSAKVKEIDERGDNSKCKYTETSTNKPGASHLDIWTLDQTSIAHDDEPNLAKAAPRSSTEEEHGQDKEARKVDTFEEFSGYTTLHGVRFIGDRTSILPRRCLWVLIVLLCTALFGVQVYDRFNLFLAWPVTVNFMVNYPGKIAFPAVTLCNQNHFRLSKAYEDDWLQFITDFYDNNDALPASSEPHLNTSISELFEGLAHNKEDFIVKCQWANEECSAENFTTILTNHGICFTFNKVERPEDSLVVNESGAEHALRLTLNTEKYENRKGAKVATGINILMTDQNEVPRAEEGIALSSGVHAFVGVSVLTRNNLPPPYTECGEVPLVSAGRYNKYTCLLECETHYVYSSCGCRHFYMPDLTGEMPVCSVNQFLTCLRGALDKFNNASQTLCTCPTPCLYHIYESTVSYASSSHMKTDVEQSGVDVNSIKNRFFAAKEISSKVDETLHGTFAATLASSVENVELMMKHLQSNLTQSIESQTSLLRNIKDFIFNDLMWNIQFSYYIQLGDIEFGLTFPRDWMEKNTFTFVCDDYIGFIRDVEDSINHLAFFNQDDVSIAKYIFMRLNSSLSNKEETLTRALADYRELVIRYKNFEWNSNQSPLNNTMILNEQDITDLAEYVIRMNKYVTNMFTDSHNAVDDDLVEQFSNDVSDGCKEFITKKSKLYSDVIDIPLTTVENGLVTFFDWQTEISYIKENLEESILFFKGYVKSAINETFGSLLGELSYAQKYLNDTVSLVSKYDIADRNSYERIINEIKTFFNNIDIRTIGIVDTWSSLGDKFSDLENFTQHVDDTLSWFLSLNTSIMLLRATELNNKTKNIKETVEIGHSSDDLALKSVAGIIKMLDEYHADHTMDEDFYRRNFLRVDVYFKELRSEEITQQKAYDNIALLCDIGGATGLCIGGSVITIFEIVEFLLMCLMCKMCRNKKKLCDCKTASSVWLYFADHKVWPYIV